ncbi:putative serine/threonine-protein kinase-like protein CCR3 [Cajanus cajan]|uniref:putative serine/threonine-protein kinase-like protein CCR3 n=1 Tax=Cajanus cajan TaxID=3821 RepID=UPI00098DB787|nr:putative serine/threonine-protein kinase-like protein CCR3 [Cajanus cajan]
MANQMDGSIDMRVDALSYSWRVDSMIRSETASNLGESPLPSFGSRVDRAIRSRTPSSMSNFGTSPLHTFPRLFTLSELQTATNNFSFHNRIGIGNSGFVYRGKLDDGGEVAIKRSDALSNTKTPFNSELAILSRVPQHEHLVGVVGLCQERSESFLVYEYMNNGSLYDNLHYKYNSVLSSWKMSIKIALDVSRGIQYLLNNTVPHVDRVIKSCNILLDGTWTARVSDFRLTFKKNTMGWVDCIHPKGKCANEMTEEKDVYALGVVLLELLTGKRPDFRYWDDRDTLLKSKKDIKSLSCKNRYSLLAELA